MKPARIAIMGSTNGSVVPGLYNQIKTINADIALIFSNKAHAGILEKARQLNIPYEYFELKGLNREAYDKKITALLTQHHIDLIVLIGYMRILSDEFVKTWKNRVINIHPSLLPKHGGLMDLAVHQAVLAAKDKQTGCTAHLVNEQLDGGEILIQKYCEVHEDDTTENLKQRVQALECEALFAAVKKLINDNKD